MIPTPHEDVLHFVPSVGIFLTKFNSVGIFPTKFSIKHYTCRNHASYTSVKFLPALYLKITISYLVWNMLASIKTTPIVYTASNYGLWLTPINTFFNFYVEQTTNISS